MQPHLWPLDVTLSNSPVVIQSETLYGPTLQDNILMAMPLRKLNIGEGSSKVRYTCNHRAQEHITAQLYHQQSCTGPSVRLNWHSCPLRNQLNMSCVLQGQRCSCQLGIQARCL